LKAWQLGVRLHKQLLLNQQCRLAWGLPVVKEGRAVDMEHVTQRLRSACAMLPG